MSEEAVTFGPKVWKVWLPEGSHAERGVAVDKAVDDYLTRYQKRHKFIAFPGGTPPDLFRHLHHSERHPDRQVEARCHPDADPNLVILSDEELPGWSR